MFLGLGHDAARVEEAFARAGATAAIEARDASVALRIAEALGGEPRAAEVR